MFQKMGYRIHTHDQINWDIMWSHTYPFYSLAKEMAHLKLTQKVIYFGNELLCIFQRFIFMYRL